MRRRSRAGGEPVKMRRRKAMTLKRGIAPKPTSDRRRSAAGLQEQLDHRTRELNEALEQQAATSEVLHVISSAPGRLEPVFQGHTDESNAHLPGQIWQLVAPRGRQRSYCRDAWRALRVPRISESRIGRRSSPRSTGRLKSGSGSNRRHKEGPNSRHEDTSRNDQACESTQPDRSADAQGKRGDWWNRNLPPGGAAIQR